MVTAHAVAIRRGAWVTKINRFVDCVCADGQVPEYLEVDLTGVEVDKKLRLRDICLPEGVVPAKGVSPDFLLGILDGRRRDS
jgi:large subunit ribosomal protein L25